MGRAAYGFAPGSGDDENVCTSGGSVFIFFMECGSRRGKANPVTDGGAQSSSFCTRAKWPRRFDRQCETRCVWQLSCKYTIRRRAIENEQHSSPGYRCGRIYRVSRVSAPNGEGQERAWD